MAVGAWGARAQEDRAVGLSLALNQGSPAPPGILGDISGFHSSGGGGAAGISGPGSEMLLQVLHCTAQPPPQQRMVLNATLNAQKPGTNSVFPCLGCEEGPQVPGLSLPVQGACRAPTGAIRSQCRPLCLGLGTRVDHANLSLCCCDRSPPLLLPQPPLSRWELPWWLNPLRSHPKRLRDGLLVPPTRAVGGRAMAPWGVMRVRTEGVVPPG